MTVKDLISYLSDLNPDAKIVIGCNGKRTSDDQEDENDLILAIDSTENVNILDGFNYSLF